MLLPACELAGLAPDEWPLSAVRRLTRMTRCSLDARTPVHSLVICAGPYDAEAPYGCKRDTELCVPTPEGWVIGLHGVNRGRREARTDPSTYYDRS